jgi:predicted dehydrogenase
MDEVVAVVIATPPDTHTAQVVQCLQAGKSVLIEKPLCTSMAEVEAIARAAEAAPPGCTVMVAENYYYKPSLLAMKALIGDGRLGRLRRLQVRKLTRQVDDGWKSNYGALLEGGIHFVALICDLVDAAMALEAGALASPTVVEADFPTRRARSEAERHSVTTLSYDGDITASLHYAWDSPSLLRGTFQHSRVEGDAGCIVFESNGLYMCHGVGLSRKVRGPQLGDLMGYGAMTSDFLACVADPERRPYSDLARAKRDLAIVFEAYGENH